MASNIQPTSQPSDFGSSEMRVGLPIYEALLKQNWEWAMDEGGRFFDEKSRVHQTLTSIASRFDELAISYAIVGGMALFRHGFQRFTEDVDLLVTRETLQKIHTELEGRGYLPPFSKSKHLRDTTTGVRIEFLVTGEFPGDGKPKPLAFPDPKDVSETFKGLHFLKLNALVDLKLASGMTNPNRAKDLDDVRQLIKIKGLPRDFNSQLNVFVRDAYLKIWDEQSAAVRYLMNWECPELTVRCKDWAELIEALPLRADELRMMQSDGLTLDLSQSQTPSSIWFVSRDPSLAKKYDMHEDRDFMNF